MGQPIQIYLDQMVVSNAAEDVDWRTSHYLGTFLAPLVASAEVRVRPSLAHFSETVLYVDADEEHGCALLDTDKLDKRQRIAQIVCALSDFDNAIPRWEVLALRDLAVALAELVPTAVDMKAFEELERLDRVGLRAKLDALAANRMAHNPDFYAHAWGSKLLTQLFQAALRNETHLEMLLGDVGSGEKVALGLDDALAHLPLRELRPFVAERLAAFAKLDASKARKLWQRNRKAIESAYTVDSLLRTLIYFLESKEPLPPIFNLHALAKNWPAIEARIGKVQLPEPLPNLELAIQRHMPKNVIVARMFQPIVERLLAKADLPTSRTAIYVAALQVEAALGDKVPGTGNVFDAERAIALHEVDVFHTTDVRLVAQAKQARNRFGLDVEVTDSEKELRRVIAARMRTR